MKKPETEEERAPPSYGCLEIIRQIPGPTFECSGRGRAESAPRKDVWQRRRGEGSPSGETFAEEALRGAQKSCGEGRRGGSLSCQAADAAAI